MKKRLALFLCLLTTTVSGAKAEGWPPASDYTYQDNCDSYPDADECQKNTVYFTKAYEKAITGDYEGQRVIAMLFGLETRGVFFRPPLACAWSNVILRSGHLLATSDDTKNNKSYCDHLTLQEQTLATAQTARMLQLLSR